jgi:hypothetical protein
MEIEVLIQICRSRNEMDFLFAITKIVAENDSMADGLSFPYHYTREKFNNGEKLPVSLKEKELGYSAQYCKFLEFGGAPIYEKYLHQIGILPLKEESDTTSQMTFQYVPPSPPEVTNQVEPAYITVNKNGATSPFVIEFFPPLPETSPKEKDEFNPLGDFIKDEIAIWDSGNGYDLVKIESGDVVFGNITVEILTGKFPGRSSFPPSEIFKYSKELCDSLALRYGYERTTTIPATDE